MLIKDFYKKLSTYQKRLGIHYEIRNTVCPEPLKGGHPVPKDTTEFCGICQ